MSGWDLLKVAGLSILESMADNATETCQRRARNKEISEESRNDYLDKSNQFKYAKDYFGNLKDQVQGEIKSREMAEEREQRKKDRFKKLYAKAVENQDIDAQYDLGLCYDNGEGVEKDEVEAVKWYRKAAEQGHVNAQYNLAICYDNGEGVEKDEVEAVKWYRKAAEQGHDDAQHNLKIYQKKMNEEKSLLNIKITESDKKLIANKGLWLIYSRDTAKIYDKALKNIGIVILEVEDNIVYIVRAIDLKHGGILKEINKILSGNVKKIEKRVSQNQENITIKFLSVSSSINDIGRINLLEKMLIEQYHPAWN